MRTCRLPDPSSRNPGIEVVDTVTKLDDRHRGQVVIGASHGGVYAAYCAARGGVLGVVLNDAGVGLDRAGIAGLDYLDGLDIPAAAASHDSCRIGDGADMAEHGIVSHVNERARSLGCRPGERVMDCARRMLAATPSTRPVPEKGETRRVEPRGAGDPPVVVMDSITLALPEDEGRIIVAASHGALFGPQKKTLIEVDALAWVFSDAGVGKDRAGIARIFALDERDTPAVTVSAQSARIGDGGSLLATGIVSHVNRTAAALDAAPGMSTREFLARVRVARGGGRDTR